MGRGNESPNNFSRGPGTLQELIRIAIRNHSLGIRTCIPATVAVYDPATQKAEVILGNLKVRYVDDGEVPNKPLQINVPVAWPRTAFGYLTFPLIANDTGFIVISDRSIEKWMVAGVPGDPGLRHTHNEIDGIFIPGLHPDSNPITPPTSLTDVVLNGAQISLGATASEHVVKAETFVALMDAMVAAAVSAASGITPPNGDGGTAAFAAFQGAWNSAKANILTTKVKAE